VWVPSLQQLLMLQPAAPAAASRLNAMYASAACPEAGCALVPRGDRHRSGALDVDEEDEADDADVRCSVDLGVPWATKGVLQQCAWIPSRRQC
jgi:hypothetical protein